MLLLCPLDVSPSCLQAETHHSSCENRGHTKVPRGFSPNTRLLDLRGNHFHYIASNSFPAVAQVVSLHLQRCKIVEVESGAFSGMKGLIYLYLSENDLTSLSPDAFKGLLNVRSSWKRIPGNMVIFCPVFVIKMCCHDLNPQVSLS